MRTGKQIKVPSTGGAGKFLNGSSCTRIRASLPPPAESPSGK